MNGRQIIEFIESYQTLVPLKKWERELMLQALLAAAVWAKKPGNSTVYFKN